MSKHLPEPCTRCGHSEEAHADDKDCMCGNCTWFVRAQRCEGCGRMSICRCTDDGFLRLTADCHLHGEATYEDAS